MNALACWFALTLLAASLVAQPKPTIELCAESLAESVLRELNDAPSTLIFAPDSTAGLKRELDLRLQAALLARGFQVRESPSENALEIRYDLQSASVKAEEAGTKARRVVSLAIFLRLVSNGELKLAKPLSAERIDTLSLAELERLNDPRYPETTIEPRRDWLERAIAPALTTLSLGIIVYLFFSVRSN
ncbi:MAG: hypothetical protein NZM06_11115 [Chloroherpetonaceae bacterium]|nr:hypothetical protein [Chloroherpetonaceae bacterium]MDW8438163.1 hypothetical protein [Chloroherpetonaceae bacterium]